MPTVSDPSPILNLARIGRLRLLEDQFGQVHIPPAVMEELQFLSQNQAATEIEAVLNASWLIITPLKSSVLARQLQLELDEGESEAIALALEMPAETVLIDEPEGRLVASHLGLKITGVVGILIQAKKLGRIPVIAPELGKLRRQANFFLSPSVPGGSRSGQAGPLPHGNRTGTCYYRKIRLD